MYLIAVLLEGGKDFWNAAVQHAGPYRSMSLCLSFVTDHC